MGGCVSVEAHLGGQEVSTGDPHLLTEDTQVDADLDAGQGGHQFTHHPGWRVREAAI